MGFFLPQLFNRSMVYSMTPKASDATCTALVTASDGPDDEIGTLVIPTDDHPRKGALIAKRVACVAACATVMCAAVATCSGWGRVPGRGGLDSSAVVNSSVGLFHKPDGMGFLCGQQWGHSCASWTCIRCRSSACNDGLQCRATPHDWNNCNSCMKPERSVPRLGLCTDSSECSEGHCTGHLCCKSRSQGLEAFACRKFAPHLPDLLGALTSNPQTACAAAVAAAGVTCTAELPVGRPIGCAVVMEAICAKVVSSLGDAGKKEVMKQMASQKDWDGLCETMGYGIDQC